MGGEYLCWRITKKLEKSMENCTIGGLDPCANLKKDDVGVCGERIRV